MLKVDGFDDCVVGTVEGYSREPVLVYDYEKMIDKLTERDGMDREEAVEFFEFNIAGAYLGAGMPMFLMRDEDVLDSIV